MEDSRTQKDLHLLDFPLSLISWLTSAEFFNISEQQFFHLKKKKKDSIPMPHWMLRKMKGDNDVHRLSGDRGRIRAVPHSR